jgi:hypothetical protein
LKFSFWTRKAEKWGKKRGFANFRLRAKQTETGELMENEPQTTQQRIDALIKELETNGGFSLELASDIPAILAAIPDGEIFDLVEQTFRTFRDTWRRHPDVERLFRYLVVLIERDRTRRALMENIECGQLEKIAEL